MGEVSLKMFWSKIVGMGVQHCEHTKNHLIASFKVVKKVITL
jgi:hypothetical protein